MSPGGIAIYCRHVSSGAARVRPSGACACLGGVGGRANYRTRDRSVRYRSIQGPLLA